MMRQLFVLLLSSSVLVSCSMFKVKHRAADEEVNEGNMADFNAGLKALDQENYEEASNIFLKLLTEKPATELDMVTIYNLGAAYEGLGQCQKAAQRYLQVARGAINKFPRILGESLYRLSYAYECLGLDNKVIIALLDVKKRSATLPLEISKAEAPARLAAAYARIGNRDQSKVYFTQAENGLRELQSHVATRKQAAEIAAKTLFFMGRLTSLDAQMAKRPEDYIDSLATLQPFLIRSVGLDVKVWSEKSAEQIIEAYQRLIELLDTTKVNEDPSDPGINERLTRDKKVSLLKYAVQTLRELKFKKLPGQPDKGSLEARVFLQVDTFEKQMQGLLVSSSENTLKTPDAERREGLKREGRIKDKHP